MSGSLSDHPTAMDHRPTTASFISARAALGLGAAAIETIQRPQHPTGGTDDNQTYA